MFVELVLSMPVILIGGLKVRFRQTSPFLPTAPFPGFRAVQRGDFMAQFL
jgi:hypothetical protein